MYLVLVSEVTQMSGGIFCVAGWALTHRQMIRPLDCDSFHWQERMVRKYWQVGNLVELRASGERTKQLPHATEDLPLKAQPVVIKNYAESDLHAMLRPNSDETVQKIFGRPLRQNYFPDGAVRRSLGSIATRRSELEFHHNGRLRLRITDKDERKYNLPVTCDMLKREFGENADGANAWLHQVPADKEVLIRIGLARGWSGPENSYDPLRCYAQINGVIRP